MFMTMSLKDAAAMDQRMERNVLREIGTETRQITRRLSVGAEFLPGGGVHFRFWAPRCRTVRVQITSQGQRVQKPRVLDADDGGFFSLTVADATAGDQYGYLLNDDETRYPDPASRFQPEGPHGPSEMID